MVSEPNAIVVASHLLWIEGQSGKQITPMQLLKLVYISHGWMLGLYDDPLFSDDVEAWLYGPVIRDVYDEYKKFGGGQIGTSGTCEKLNPYANNIITQVANVYGKYDGWQLSRLTHKPGSPWAITIADAGANSVIPNPLIRHHYKQLSEENES